MQTDRCYSHEEISACLLGALGDQELERVGRHLAGCAACGEIADSLESVSDEVVGLLMRPAPASEYLDEPELQRALAQADALADELPISAVQGASTVAESEMTLPQGLGHYRLIEKLGEGGMGSVFMALHTKLDKIVALKVLPPDRMQDVSAVARFEREMKAVGKLEHANIVRAMDAGQVQGTHFLVMEYVEGLDLSRLSRRLGPLSVADACELMRQAARGLQHAHEHGLVHRDVKPSNLMLTTAGQLKILDLGLARLHSAEPPGEDLTGSGQVTGAADCMAPEQAGEELTANGQVMGTAGYMAPEQATETHTVDIRADIYSLGCTLYRLLTAKGLYAGDSPGKILLAHREASIPSLLEERPDVPEALEGLFQKMVAKTPEDRCQSMTEVIRALESCAANERPPVAAEASRDSALASLLQDLFEGGVSTKREAVTVAEETIRSKAEKTDKRIWRKIIPLDRRLWRRLAGTAAMSALLVVLFGVILTLRTPEGTLIVIVNEPDAVVQVLSEEGKVEIDRKNDTRRLTISVDPGKHRLRVEKDGFSLFTKDFAIESRGKEVITARLERLVGTTDPDSPQWPGPLPNGWSFGEPVNLGPIVNDTSDVFDADLSSDGLTLLFASPRPGGLGQGDLWTCTRASLSDPFGDPVNLGPPINSKQADGSLDLSADGLTLILSSHRSVRQGASDLWISTRPSLVEPFGDPVNLGPNVNSIHHDRYPALSTDGLALVFQSDRPGGCGEEDLWMSTRASTTEPFGDPVNLGPTVNSGKWDGTPAFSMDCCTLVFGSNRDGGLGGADLWMCTRPSPSEPFGDPVNLGPVVNSRDPDRCPTLSADGLWLLFVSPRPGGHGGSDLWMAPINLPGSATTPKSEGGTGVEMTIPSRR